MQTERERTKAVVVGSGPAGLGAAIAAGRQGVATLLLEASGQLGGATTASLVNHMIKTAGCEGGIIREIWQRLHGYDSAWERSGFHEVVWVNPYVYEMVVLEMLEEAGVEVLTHASVDDVIMDGRDLCGLRGVTKDGREEIKTQIVIDASGDGDVAVRAGAPFEKGRDGDGALQAVNLNFLVVGVDVERFPRPEAFSALSRRAVAEGRVTLPDHVKEIPLSNLQRAAERHGVLHMSFDLAMDVDASDARSLSRGEILCKKRIFQIWRFLCSDVGGCEACELIKIAPRLGIRETRRIMGEYVFTEDGVLKGRKFDDGVARGSFYMDLYDGQKKDCGTEEATQSAGRRLL